jgi:PAS domain-containing protein/serine phosphatase RsbU (regulator of sigma subunit)
LENNKDGRHSVKLFRSLTAKLLLIYVPLVCVSVLALFVVLENRFLSDQKTELEQKMTKQLEVASAAIAVPVWEFDIESVEFLLSAISHDTDVQSITVHDVHGKVIAHVDDQIDRPLEDTLKGENDLTYTSGSVQEVVGRLSITFHQDEIKRDLYKRIKTDAVIVLSLAAILLTVIWVTTRKVIGLPLAHLQNAIESSKESGKRARVEWESSDELGQVVRAYNEMQAQQTAAEAEVKRYRDHLETLVAERTSELEASQSDLTQKTDILQATLNSISQGLAAFDGELKLIAWNDKYLETRGYPEGFAKIGRAFEDFIRFDVEHGEFGDGDPEQQFSEQVDRAKLFQPHEFERLRPNGRTIEIRGGPIPGGGFVSTYADITERKLAEAEIEEKEAQLRLAIDNMTGGIFLVDHELNLQVFNDNFAKMYDLPPGMVQKGSPIHNVIRFRAERGDYGAGDVEQQVKDRVLGYGKRERVQLEDNIPGGRTIELFRATSEDGDVVAMFNDITERKISEEALKLAHNLITESIGYASRIQRSVLPTKSTLDTLFDDHLLIWEPKDIVGGDMFWHRSCESGELVIAADCTGHGVPGAFMTMIATGALDQALIEIPNGYPSALLQRMNQLIKAVLGQDTDESESDDGLELGICHIDTYSGEMLFAGARFFLWQLKDNEIIEIKGDKKGIGYCHIDQMTSFETKQIDKTAGMSFYMTSDGLIDQIGGVKKRSFGKKRIRQLILDSSELTMEQQKDHILREFARYQGDQERRDDVTVFGFRVA